MFADVTEPRFYNPAFGHSQEETVPLFRFRCSCCGAHIEESEVRDAAGELVHGHRVACGPVIRECAASHDELVAWLWEASAEAPKRR